MGLIVGVPKERMCGENRVPILPDTVEKLLHDLGIRGVIAGFIVESGLGGGIGLRDEDWKRVKCIVVPNVELVYGLADIILGVKQPLPKTVPLYRTGQGSCCFQHVRVNEAVVRQLLQKGVKILPFEADRKSLYAMSRMVGSCIRQVLERCWQGDWRGANILVIGARGTVGRHCVDNLILAGLDPKKIHACDVVEGQFETNDTVVPRSYRTFRMDQTEFILALKVSRILIIAALDREGRAPKIIEARHLELIPDGGLIVQVNIDEGGSIADERFCRLTFWDDPVYEAAIGPNIIKICNVPDIPTIKAEESSRALEGANYNYYLELLRTWPNVSPELLFTAF